MSNPLFDILRETFSHPLSASNISYSQSAPLILREGGVYPHIVLDHIDLAGASLKNADLNGASFHGANLTGVNFSGANLAGADFTGANISGAIFDGAQTHDTKFYQVVYHVPPSGVYLEGGQHGR